MVSAFDRAFLDYGVKMYRSFAKFNPTVPMCFADFSQHGWSAIKDLRPLTSIGVTILRPTETVPTVRHNFWDMLLLPFVDGYEWDAMMWLDADTLVLRDLEPAWAHPKVDYTGHPDRRDGDWVKRCSVVSGRVVPGDDKTRFASGLWVCRNRKLLADMYEWVRANRPVVGRDSDAITAVVNDGSYSHYQLDGSRFNFGRELIPQAEYHRRRIRYRLADRWVYPYIAAFSRVPVVPGVRDERMRSDALDRFYQEQVLATR